MIDISSRIREVRHSTGLSQEKFAQKIGVSRSTLALTEAGKSNPGYDTIHDICMKFGIMPAYFFEEGAGELDKYKDDHKGANILSGSARLSAGKGYGSLVKDNLKKELANNHKQLLDLYGALSELPDLLQILNEFMPTLSVEDTDNIGRHLTTDTGGKRAIDYNSYAPAIINYLNAISEQRASIVHFKKELNKFLQAMKPLDVDGKIPAFI
jgi:transcriptional regulator with XRE-family HTH domain